MTQPGSIVRCIRGAEGILEQGAIYTVWDVTEEGHLKLEEVNPPEPYNCFNKDRFEDTGDFVAFEDYSLADSELFTEEELAVI